MIFVSTGGFANEKAMDIALKMYEYGINRVELSGGLYDRHLQEKIERKPDGLVVQAHNYFPTPKDSIVVNLSSNVETIREASINFLKRSLEWNKTVGINYISFHGGFLVDPSPSELGRTIQNRKLIPREIGINNFIESVQTLSKFADSIGSSLLIENNVLTKGNLESFGENPLLFVEPKETLEIMSKLPDHVGLLLDVAHLKVSSKTLSFGKEDFITALRNRIQALHLSDNDGLEDTNRPIHENSWFWDKIHKEIKFCTLEVYTNDFDMLRDQFDFAAKKLNYLI